MNRTAKTLSDSNGDENSIQTKAIFGIAKSADLMATEILCEDIHRQGRPLTHPIRDEALCPARSAAALRTALSDSQIAETKRHSQSLLFVVIAVVAHACNRSSVPFHGY